MRLIKLLATVGGLLLEGDSFLLWHHLVGVA